jgi:hypothetical protein
MGPSTSWEMFEEFKHLLFIHNFSKYNSLAELKANVDFRTVKDQWEKLATMWYSRK